MPITKSRVEGIRGSLTTCAGEFPARITYPALCTPVIAVHATTKPVRFSGSLDGVNFAPMRNLDGIEVRITKPGTYRLPVPVLFLDICTEDDAAIIQTFAGASHD